MILKIKSRIGGEEKEKNAERCSVGKGYANSSAMAKGDRIERREESDAHKAHAKVCYEGE